MSYSPYGDRDSGSTRTDVDNEVHNDREQPFDQDAIGHDANGAPLQRDSTEDESIGGEVVDQDGNVFEPDHGDAASDARPEAAAADSTEVDSTETDSTEAPEAVYAEHADTTDGEESAADTGAPEAEADGHDAVATDEEAGTGEEAGTVEDVDGPVRADEATATDVDSPDHADATFDRDTATEDAMAGDDGQTDVPADDATNADATNTDATHADASDADVLADDSGSDAVLANGSDLHGSDLDGSDIDGPAEDTNDGPVDADPTVVSADAALDADDDEAADDGVDEEDRALAADGTPDSDAIDAMPDFGDAATVRTDRGDDDEDAATNLGAVGTADGDVPVAGAIDTDYVAVGVAEPLTESEAADIAEADGQAWSPDAADPALVGAAAAASAETTAPADTTANAGMMPGDAPVVDTGHPMPNADEVHERWQQIQLGFIDDPRGSVESARSLVVEAIEARISALRDRQTALDGWQSEATPDTEVLRAAIQGYRDLLNSLTDTP